MSRVLHHAFSIAPDHPSLAGHFPGNPLVPGVLLLDQVFAVVQAAGIDAAGWCLPQVKFLRPLRPGQAARIEVETGASSLRFRILTEQDVLASGELRALA